MACSRPGSCQSCLIIYSDGDPRHTKGKGRNISKTQTLLFNHIIALLLSLLLVQWYSDTNYAQNSFSLLWCKLKCNDLYCDPFLPWEMVFSSHDLKIFWKQEFYNQTPPPPTKPKTKKNPKPPKSKTKKPQTTKTNKKPTNNQKISPKTKK